MVQPLIRVKNLLLPALLEASEISAQAYGKDSQTFLQATKEMWTTFLSQFNILYSLRTFPIGVPSLLFSKGVTENPVGPARIIELQSTDNALLIMLGLSALGLILGCLYFALIARVMDPENKPVKFPQLMQEILQGLLLSFILILALMVLSIPALCLVSSIALLLPSVGSLPLLLFSIIMVWVLLPVVFSPHGIFTNQLKATTAIANSFRLVRASMNRTGLLFIILLLLSYGMDTLWSTPATNSWMLLIGILGHGFVSSGLIASSFAFYNNSMKWMQTIIREINAGKAKIIS
jgi:hypothetical protein